MEKLTKISGSGAFVAKAKIASLANEYAKNHDVIGGKDTIIATWVNKFDLVPEEDRKNCKEEILTLCAVMEEQKITSIDRIGYHKLKASNTGSKILDTFRAAFDDGDTNESAPSTSN